MTFNALTFNLTKYIFHIFLYHLYKMFVCEGAMALLRPLLLDVAPNIQQTAALALGRLANYNEDLAEAVVKGDILPQLVYSLAEQNVIFFVYIHGQQKFFLAVVK